MTDCVTVVETIVIVDIVNSETTTVEVVTAGPQGIRGVQGLPGDGSTVTFVAATALGGHRIVAAAFNGKAKYADNSDTSTANNVLGMTVGAAAQDASVVVQQSGELVEPSWSWEEAKPVFCGASGVPTQIPPTSGFSLVIGVATSPTSIAIGVKQPIIL